MQETDGKIVVPSPAEVQVLCQWLRDEQELARVKEEAQLQTHAGNPLPKVLPLRDGKEDAAQMLGFIPPKFYWSRRKKYGRGMFNTEAGIKDVKRHHPKFFCETISGKAVSGYGGRYAGQTVQTNRRRVYFARGTLTPAS